MVQIGFIAFAHVVVQQCLLNANYEYVVLYGLFE